MDNDNFFRRFYHNHYVLSNLGMMACILLFLGFFAFFLIDVWTSHGKSTNVPDIRNMPLAEAIHVLESHDLNYDISDSVYDSKLKPGVVREIWPHPGSSVKPGRVVYLTINSFTPQQITISMPLTGVSSRQALSYLESLNIRNIRIVYVPSSFPDLVEGARYKGVSIKPGMQIPVNGEIVLEVGVMDHSVNVNPTDNDVATDVELIDETDMIDDTEQSSANSGVFD